MIRTACTSLLLAALVLPAGCLHPTRARYLNGGFFTAVEQEARPVARSCRLRRFSHPIATPQGLAAKLRARAPGARYELTVKGLGLRVRVSVRAPGGAAAVGARLPGGLAEAAPDTHFAPVPGFVFGVDLRRYRSIVFVVDNTYSSCADGWDPYFRERRPLLDVLADQVVAALSGLDRETRVELHSVNGRSLHLIPATTAAGRHAAMQWMCGRMCMLDGSVAPALALALAASPDVVVVLSDGRPGWEPRRNPLTPEAREAAKKKLGVLYADPVATVRAAKEPAPIVAISVGDPSTWMKRVAQLTGGAYVHRSFRAAR